MRINASYFSQRPRFSGIFQNDTMNKNEKKKIKINKIKENKLI